MTKITRCTCQNKYQDDKHGKGQRVHNSTAHKPNPKWRCTVCLVIKD